MSSYAELEARSILYAARDLAHVGEPTLHAFARMASGGIPAARRADRHFAARVLALHFAYRQDFVLSVYWSFVAATNA